MSLSLALLFSLILLAACGSGADSFSQPLPTVAVTSSTVGGTITSVPKESGTSTPSIASGFDCAGVNQIPSVECAALVALYHSTSGPNWADNDGWLATNTPCTWLGITCTRDHVSHISLFYNQLTGTLPPELGNLSELISLDISSNQLVDPLPAQLGSLAKLRNISLAHNQIGGAIPAILGKMKSLDTLNLSHNQFSGLIPEELGNLSNLTQLYLSHNKLSGPIPSTFSNLSKLFELDLSNNQLIGTVPELVTHINQRRLWGNQFDGTITANGQVPFTVDYLGVHFSADQSLATSIWPEVIPASPLPEVLEGPSYWLAIPEHIRITLADPGLSSPRRPVGFKLATEAQILIFPLAELVDTNPLVQIRIETLRNLLVKRETVPVGELPLLPLTNSAQVFHAQAQYLVSGHIQGLRFISQHSQDPHPIMLSQELFYTFQGITDDGVYYVAAFFPLTTAVLSDKIKGDDWDAFHANYDTYLSETTAILDQLLPIEFTPDLTLLDAVVTSLRVETDSVLLRDLAPHSDSYKSQGEEWPSE